MGSSPVLIWPLEFLTQVTVCAQRPSTILLQPRHTLTMEKSSLHPFDWQQWHPQRYLVITRLCFPYASVTFHSSSQAASLSSDLSGLLFHQISLGSFFTAGGSQGSPHAKGGTSGTYGTEYRHLLWGVMETGIQEHLRTTSSLQMEQFGSYMNIAITLLFVAQLGNFHSENWTGREKRAILWYTQGSLSLRIRKRNDCSQVSCCSLGQ